MSSLLTSAQMEAQMNRPVQEQEKPKVSKVRNMEDLTGNDDVDDYSDGGCRPCWCVCLLLVVIVWNMCTGLTLYCFHSSMPQGLKAILTAIVATIAWGFSLSAVGGCHFLTPNYLYCHPPPEPELTYGTCGDCHCILDSGDPDQECPSDLKEIPLIDSDVNDDWLRQLKDLNVTNPYKMVCNPYNSTDKKCTDPPQLDRQIDLWETAVCGIQYDMNKLDDDQCPTEYTLQTYDTQEELLQAGAEMTHWGACGSCSTTRDFAVYLEYPDLTAKGQECGARGLLKWSDGVECFKEVGYTHDCAVMWMYNVQHTKDKCFDVCIDFTFLGDGFNNGPPPECRIADCLLCDEQMSGPFFQTVAARSRRRSGLLSKITRSCDVILIVDHKPPCNVTRDKLRKLQEGEEGQARSLQSPTKIVAPEKWRPPAPAETCVYMTTDLGLRGHAETETNNWLLPKIFLSTDKRAQISRYDSCSAYEFDNVLSGFWSNQRDIFGSAYNAALTFGIIANVLGFVCIICLWVAACCVETKTRFWETTMTFLFAVIGLCMLLTLTFFASDVCDEGCEMGKSAAFAIVGGLLWWLAAGLAYLTGTQGPSDRSIPKASCCCCPAVIDSTGADAVVYSSVPTVGEKDEPETLTRVVVTETQTEDGGKVVEKVTTYPNGTGNIERTIYKTEPENHD